MNIYIHLLLKLLAILGVFANTSRVATDDIKLDPNLLRDIFRNNEQMPSSKNFGISKPIDQRISDVIAENVLHFGHNMGLELSALDPHATKSEIFSPLSLMAALSLLTLGAKSKSYQQLKQVLGLDSDSELIQNPNKFYEEFGLMLHDLQHKNVNKAGVSQRPNANWRYTTLKQAPVRPSRIRGPVEHIIRVANGLFVKNSYSLNPDYSQVLQSVYETQFNKLDFQNRNAEARDYINAWVNKATFGKIPKIITEDIEKSTNVILASALYFKAFWETPFFFEATTEDNFFPDGEHNPPIKVQMMPTGGIFPYYDAKEYNCRIIGLPYKGNETTMYVIQPNNSTRRRLRDLQHALDAHKINNMIDNMERKTAVMVFPKMHFTRTMYLKKILQTMNVHDIFVNGYSDLSLIGKRSQYGVEEATVEQSTPMNVHNIFGNGGCDLCLNGKKPQHGLEEAAVEQTTPSPQLTTVRNVKQNGPVPYELIRREKPVYDIPEFTDRYDEPALIFTSRLGEMENLVNDTQILENNLTTENSTIPVDAQLSKREKRQVLNFQQNIASLALSNLESSRQKVDSYKSDLYVDDIIHSVDFSVDEQGTEAAAATLTYLHRSGTDVVFRGDTPFLIVIRHDPTKLPLFYGIINKPEL